MVDGYVYDADADAMSAECNVVSFKRYGDVVLAVAAVADGGSDEW